jgi:uncharacterized membrane-anchored protein
MSKEFTLTILNEKRGKIEEILESYIGKNISVSISQVCIRNDDIMSVMIDKIIINEIDKEIVFNKHVIIATKNGIESNIEHIKSDQLTEENNTIIGLKRTISGTICKDDVSLIISV